MPKLSAIHPGDILKTEFLEPMGLTPFRLSQELHVTAPRVNDIVLERRGITAEMALRLGRFFGTSAQFWSNLQTEYDRRVALNALPSAELASITPHRGVEAMERPAAPEMPEKGLPAKKVGKLRKGRVLA